MTHSTGDLRAPDWSGGENAEPGVARRIPGTSNTTHFRLQRLERLAWILDRSIPVGRFRVGLDPIIGLIPGAGDTIGAVLALYIVYEAARLGAPGGVLARMVANVLVEAVVGAVPVAGDLFDFYYKASTRNMALIHRHYSPAWKPRPLRSVGLAVVITALILFGTLGVLAFLVIKWVVNTIGW